MNRLFATAATLAFTTAGLADTTATSTCPNIVVIFADDLGIGDLSCYGNDKFKTPNLDKMAAEGAKMESFYVASPACSPSRAALLTGRLPLGVGVPAVLNPKSTTGLTTTVQTLPETLQSAGYATGMVGKWHLGVLPEMMPNNNGFDWWLGLPYSNDMIATEKRYYPPLPLFENKTIMEAPVDQETLTRRYTEEAIGFMDKNRQANKPFFMYVAHSFPHVPLHVSERFKGSSGAGLYGDVITELDWSVGEILKWLRDNKLSENTLVFFTSDNGPWLIKGSHAGTAEPFRDGKGSLYEGGVRVPGIAWWPGRIKPGTVVEEPASTLDFTPTFCALAGTKPPAPQAPGNVDILPLLTGGAKPAERPIFFSTKSTVGAVRVGDYKLLTNNEYYERQTTSPELYNLKADPRETRDISRERPEIADRLIRMVKEQEKVEKDRDPWKNLPTPRRDDGNFEYLTSGTVPKSSSEVKRTTPSL